MDLSKKKKKKKKLMMMMMKLAHEVDQDECHLKCVTAVDGYYWDAYRGDVMHHVDVVVVAPLTAVDHDHGPLADAFDIYC